MASSSCSRSFSWSHFSRASSYYSRSCRRSSGCWRGCSQERAETHLFERPFYRTRQLIGALNPRIDGYERTEAAQLLGRELWPLFESMSKRDQRHGLDVYRTLKEQGHTDSDLLIAALLHDSGKAAVAGVCVKLWAPNAVVLPGARAPGAPRPMARGPSGLAALDPHPQP